MMLGYQASYSVIFLVIFFLGFFFQPDRPTMQHQETHSTLKEKKGGMVLTAAKVNFIFDLLLVFLFFIHVIQLSEKWLFQLIIS